MTEKRINKYRVHLQEIEQKDGTKLGKSIEFQFENHDDVLHLIELTQKRTNFANEGENAQFIIGLKLFSDIMMKNKDNSLFEDFFPAFVDFMKKFKNKQ